jgi:hypothetical protein
MRGAWRAQEQRSAGCQRSLVLLLDLVTAARRRWSKYDGARSGAFEGEERNELVTLIDLGYALVRVGAV